MPIVKIEEDSEVLKIVLSEKKAGQGAQTILKVIVLTLFILPFLVLIFNGFEVLIIGTFVIVYLVAYYFLRIYLWNAFGEETIIIDNEKLSQVFNYGWFTEEDVNVLENENLQILFNNEQLKRLKENSEEILDMETIRIEMTEINIGFYKNDKEYFFIKTKTSSQETKELTNKILNRLN